MQCSPKKVVSYLFFLFPFSLHSCFPIYAMLTIVYFSSQYYERHVGETYFRSFRIMWVLPEYFVRFFRVICLTNIKSLRRKQAKGPRAKRSANRGCNIPYQVYTINFCSYIPIFPKSLSTLKQENFVVHLVSNSAINL